MSPHVLKVDNDGLPDSTQPYGFESNPYSILDVADIVYINPVNPGYSLIVKYEDRKADSDKFSEINEGIEYLAEWLNTFVSNKQRWEPPKHLNRQKLWQNSLDRGCLSLALQNKQWMYLNVVIMVSPADYKLIRAENPILSALIPYYTAKAQYHRRLHAELQKLDPTQILPQAKRFAVDNLIPAIARGGFSNIKKIVRLDSSYMGIV